MRMDPSVLPEELFEEIAKYLEVSDLLACCLVSLRWRSAVNNNRIWFRLVAERCPTVSWGQEKDEEEEEEEEDEGLERLCFWRLRFMEEAFTSRNWYRGRYEEQVICEYEDPQLVDCSEDTVVLADRTARTLTLFDFGGLGGEVRRDRVDCLMNHVSISFFLLCQDYLVVTQCTLLHIFKKSPQGFELQGRFLFDSEAEDSVVPPSGDVSDWYETTVGLYPSDIYTLCDHNGSHFVGVVSDGQFDGVHFHVWDLESNRRQGSVPLPPTQEPKQDLLMSLKGSRLYLLTKSWLGAGDLSTILCYDLHSQSYSGLRLQLQYDIPFALFTQDHAILSAKDSKHLTIFDSASGSYIHSVSSPNEICPFTLRTSLPYIVMAANTTFSGTVSLFNLKTLVTDFSLGLNFRIRNLQYIRTRLILVGGWRSVALYDLNTNSKLYDFNFNECLWMSPNQSKIVVESGEQLSLLRF